MRSLVTREIHVTNVIHIGDENLVMLVFFVSDACIAASPMRGSGIVVVAYVFQCRSSQSLEIGDYFHICKNKLYYGRQAHCRVLGTLGKGRNALGEEFAECNTRQKSLGHQSDGEASFAECLFSGTRQIFAVYQHALGNIK